VTIGLELAPGSCSQTYLYTYVYIYRRWQKRPPITFGMGGNNNDSNWSAYTQVQHGYLHDFWT